MKIAIACDHAGFILKEAVAKFLRDERHEVQDFGTWSLDSVDYVDFLYPAALAVAKAECAGGVLIPGIAYAGAILANKVPGIRAAAVEDLFAARICREHGDANILCLSGQTLGAGLAREMLRTFLTTPFLGGKYAARNEKLRRIEAIHMSPLSAPSPPPNPSPNRPPSATPADPSENGSSAKPAPLELITENDVRKALHAKAPLRAKRNCLITPAARDLIEQESLRIEVL